MGFFGNLDPEPYDRQYGDLTLVRRLVRYFGAHRRAAAVVVVATLLVAGLDVAVPLLISRGVNALEETFPAPLMWILVGAVLLAGVLSWGVNYLRRRLATRVVADVILTVRRDAFRATVAHDLSFYDEHRAGKVVSRITSDTQDFSQLVTLVTETISQLLVVAALLVILARIEWRLTLALLATAPVVVLVAGGFRRLARYVTRQGNRAMANVNAAIQESVSGIAVAKNFRQEGVIYDEFRQVNRTSYQINIRRGFVLASVFPALNIVAGLAVALLLYLGGRAAGLGLITAGAWYLFLQSVDRFFFPFVNLASFWSQVQAGLSAAERVFALIDAEPVVKQTAAEPVPALRGEIEFERLGFRYSRQETVLEDFSLRVAPGETVALVGHTGAGKSSIVKLIARFYEFQHGRLLIDGRDIRSLDLRAYRQHLGIVSQTPFLFAGTVADNIRYARPEATDEEIEAVARQVGRGEWLETLPDGLQTLVGQRGARLSMGQRQLVALMRVLVQRPAIFILDEATASVDPFTEAQIQEALELILGKRAIFPVPPLPPATSRQTSRAGGDGGMAGGTGIIIAHRLSTVRNADRIVVLQKGRIIEEGSHAALLRQGGHYAELYNTYFRHQSLEYVDTAAAFR